LITEHGTVMADPGVPRAAYGNPAGRSPRIYLSTVSDMPNRGLGEPILAQSEVRNQISSGALAGNSVFNSRLNRLNPDTASPFVNGFSPEGRAADALSSQHRLPECHAQLFDHIRVKPHVRRFPRLDSREAFWSTVAQKLNLGSEVR
jgi:hypothetical protein